jgi:hypothetical protein
MKVALQHLVGRIHDVRAEIRGDECVLVEWRLGPAALLERFGLSVSRLVGLPLGGRPLVVPWDRLDLSDPDDLRLRPAADEPAPRKE